VTSPRCPALPVTGPTWVPRPESGDGRKAVAWLVRPVRGALVPGNLATGGQPGSPASYSLVRVGPVQLCLAWVGLV
jgi:hypothetical protein